MMLKQLALGSTALFFFALTARAATPTTDPVGEAALAERLSQMAQTNLVNRAITDTTLTEAAALLDGCVKLDKTDPRYPHLLAEACLSLHDTEGALAALNQAVQNDPSDQGAQVQIIDLYAAKMESADAKMKYFQELVASEKIAPEVRAHVGVRLASEMFNRGQDAGAKEALDNALKLNPLDPDGLEMKELQTRTGPTRDHVTALLAMLRGNPAQPVIEARLADELAGEGLTNEAATWYSNSIGVGGKLNMPTDPAVFLNYVCELLIGNQTKGIDTALDSLLKVDAANQQALYLKLMLVRRGEDKDATAKAMDEARDGFLERLYRAYRGALKNDPPSTRPTGELLERAGDVVAQAREVKKTANEAAIADYASALTDLAWFEVYFAQTPAPATQLVAALHELLPEDDARFARLEGWALLAANKPDEAKVKLSAVAERDPLSAMGMIRIAAKDPAQQAQAKPSAQALLDDNRAGLLAAMLLDGLKEFGVNVQVSSAGNEIKADLEKFPKTWFTFLDSPDSFYSISCQAMKVSHEFDEPIYAVVTVINTSPFAVSIGPKGALKPDLYFDVNIRGPQAPQNVTGVAYDRMVKRLVLQPNANFQQLVRLDQPKLAQGLAQNPVPAISLLFSLVTNPITGVSGNIAPGPGGVRVPLRKPVERAASPINLQRQQLVQQNLVNARTDIRIRTMSLVATYAQMFAQSKDEKVQAQAKQLAETIGELASDPDQPVAAWSRMLRISLESPDHRGETLKAMASSDYWPQRLLAAAAALSSGENGKEILKQLSSDEQEDVKKFATAALDDLAHPATQPTTAPTPTTAPAIATPGLVSPAAPTSAPAVNFGL